MKMMMNWVTSVQVDPDEWHPHRSNWGAVAAIATSLLSTKEHSSPGNALSRYANEKINHALRLEQWGELHGLLLQLQSAIQKEIGSLMIDTQSGQRADATAAEYMITHHRRFLGHTLEPYIHQVSSIISTIKDKENHYAKSH